MCYLSRILCAFCVMFVVLAVVVIVVDVSAAISAAASNDAVVFPTTDHSDRNRSAPKGRAAGGVVHASKNHRRERVDVVVATDGSIPLTLAKELCKVADADQFLRQYVEDGRQLATSAAVAEKQVVLRGPFARDTSPKTPVPAHATCKPELRTVSVRDTDDPTLYYYPNCVRVERCGGCCTHELLACLATATTHLNYTIYVSKYVGKKILKYVGTKIVTVDRDEACACDCKIRPADCAAGQVYRKDECRCVCDNVDDETKCRSLPNKLWNSLRCRCECLEQRECSSGYYYDLDECDCKRNRETDYRYDDSFYRYGNA